MAKFESEQSQDRLQQVRQVFKRGPMTVTEAANALKVSAALMQHYIRHLSDKGEIKLMGEKSSGRHNAPANVWGLVIKPVPKPKARKALTIRNDLPMLTHWIGGNPFERLTA